MENLFGNYFLENRISATQKKDFRINFATISDWSVHLQFNLLNYECNKAGLQQRVQQRQKSLDFWWLSCQFSKIRDAEMTIKIIFERSSQKGGWQGVRKEGQQGTRLEILLSA